MMAKFLFWATGFLPCRFINDGEKDYLERYYLFTALGWRFYIHRFVGSDPDRGLHDHPFSKAYSIILSGWYFEETRTGIYGIRKVRYLNSLTGDTFHRVILPQTGHIISRLDENKKIVAERTEIPCWTLFMHKAENSKPWGFLRPVNSVSGLLYKVNQPDDGSMIFTPYRYEREGSQVDWWKTAKRRSA